MKKMGKARKAEGQYCTYDGQRRALQYIVTFTGYHNCSKYKNRKLRRFREIIS